MAKQNAATVLQQIGGKKKGKGKKGRKIGRYSKHPSSMRYRAERRWEDNRIKRIMKHIKAQPNDNQAREILAAEDSSAVRSFLALTPRLSA
jgi:hypothetical protein